MKELLLRTLTGILIIILMVGAMLLGPIPFLVLILLIYTLGMRELYSLFPQEHSPQRWLSAIPGYALFVLLFAIQTWHWSYGLLGIPFALWLIHSLLRGFDRAAGLSIFWLATPLALYLFLGWLEMETSYAPRLPLAVITLLWINDTFAYLTGSLIGKHKLTPRLSPGKTWEGLLGGLFFSLLGGWLFYTFGGVYSLSVCLSLAILVSFLSLCGDLFESGLKRRRSVKNSGEILPGHGGILDRFDSLLFVAPGAFILFMVLNLLS